MASRRRSLHDTRSPASAGGSRAFTGGRRLPRPGGEPGLKMAWRSCRGLSCADQGQANSQLSQRTRVRFPPPPEDAASGNEDKAFLRAGSFNGCTDLIVMQYLRWFSTRRRQTMNCCRSSHCRATYSRSGYNRLCCYHRLCRGRPAFRLCPVCNRVYPGGCRC